MLQDRQFYPVGSEKPVVVNVRIIVATNKDLEREVAKGSFRLDLFYRLHVIPIICRRCANGRKIFRYWRTGLKRFPSRCARTSRDQRRPCKSSCSTIGRETSVNWKYLRICDRYDPSRYADGRYDPDKGRGWEHAAGRFKFLYQGMKTSVKSYKTAKYEFEKEYMLRLLKLCGGKEVRQQSWPGNRARIFMNC